VLHPVSRSPSAMEQVDLIRWLFRKPSCPARVLLACNGQDPSRGTPKQRSWPMT